MRSSERTIEGDESDSAFAAARKLCRERAPQLFFFAQLLPRQKRDGVCAVVAIAAMLQDALQAADVQPMTGAGALRAHPVVAGPTQECCSHDKRSIDALLTMFHERLAEIYDGRLELPATASRSAAQHALHAFALTARRFEVPAIYFTSFAESLRMESTLARQVSARSLNDYLEISGGSVARAIACVLGMTSPDALENAAALGRAIRLVRLLESIGLEWKRGRLYLPQTELAKHRYSERDLAAGVSNSALRAVIDLQIEHGRRWIATASEGVCLLAGDRERLAAAWLVAACGKQLDRLQAAETPILEPPARRFSIAGALRLLPRAWRAVRQGNRIRATHHPLAR